MSIRIGASCALSLNMVTPECKVVETRRFIDLASGWYEISKKCIAEKKYLIVTLCIDKNGVLPYMPSESQWTNFVEGTVLQLQSIGANKYNCRIDIINEPMKYISKEKYAEYVNLAYFQINKRLPMGAGCDELVYTDMYQYISSHALFNTLVIHIQGACDSELKTINYTNFALNLATSYKRNIDCNEANYFSIDTDSGYKGLLMNLKYAEKIGCANFPMVFINLDKSAFSVNTDRWERLSFFVNGNQHSPYWNDFKSKIESKAPIPNLPIIEEDDMKLDEIYKEGSKGIGVQFIQMVLNRDLALDPALKVDGWWGVKTDGAVLDYQLKYGLSQYGGAIGPNTMQSMIKSYPDIWDNIQYKWSIGIR